MGQGLGKWLVAAGLVLAAAGAALWLLGDKIGWLGRLPGDIRIERPGFRFYFPVTTMLLASVLLNAIPWIVRRLLR